jgi:hypothetical protein
VDVRAQGADRRPKAGTAEDALLEIILEAGGEDLRDDGRTSRSSRPEAFENVKKASEGSRSRIVGSELFMIPQNYVRLEGKKAQQMLGIMEALEDHDDIRRSSRTSTSTSPKSRRNSGPEPVKILGIDPGSRFTGYALLEARGADERFVEEAS